MQRNDGVRLAVLLCCTCWSRPAHGLLPQPDEVAARPESDQRPTMAGLSLSVHELHQLVAGAKALVERRAKGDFTGDADWKTLKEALAHPAYGLPLNGNPFIIHLVHGFLLPECHAFFETGTFLGHSTEFVAKLWKRMPVTTVEYWPHLGLSLETISKYYPRVEQLAGDSSVHVAERAEAVCSTGPALFYLDAHSTGVPHDVTAPLSSEVRSIALACDRAWILIDDHLLPEAYRWKNDLDALLPVRLNVDSRSNTYSALYSAALHDVPHCYYHSGYANPATYFAPRNDDGAIPVLTAFGLIGLGSVCEGAEARMPFGFTPSAYGIIDPVKPRIVMQHLLRDQEVLKSDQDAQILVFVTPGLVRDRKGNKSPPAGHGAVAAHHGEISILNVLIWVDGESFSERTIFHGSGQLINLHSIPNLGPGAHTIKAQLVQFQSTDRSPATDGEWHVLVETTHVVTVSSQAKARDVLWVEAAWANPDEMGDAPQTAELLVRASASRCADPHNATCVWDLGHHAHALCVSVTFAAGMTANVTHDPLQQPSYLAASTSHVHGSQRSDICTLDRSIAVRYMLTFEHYGPSSLENLSWLEWSVRGAAAVTSVVNRGSERQYFDALFHTQEFTLRSSFDQDVAVYIER